MSNKKRIKKRKPSKKPANAPMTPELKALMESRVMNPNLRTPEVNFKQGELMRYPVFLVMVLQKEAESGIFEFSAGNDEWHVRPYMGGFLLGLKSEPLTLESQTAFICSEFVGIDVRQLTDEQVFEVVDKFIPAIDHLLCMFTSNMKDVEYDLENRWIVNPEKGTYFRSYPYKNQVIEYLIDCPFGDCGSRFTISHPVVPTKAS